MRKLLSNGRQVEDVDECGAMALHHACTNGRMSAVLFLLDNGAPINVTTETGLTPLMCAAANGHLSIVEELLQFGADITLENEDGWSASDLAHVGYHNTVAASLDRRITQHTAAHDVFEAVSLPDIIFLKYSITFHKVDPNTRNADGLTLLMLACTQSNITSASRVVRYLLSRPDIDLNAVTKNGDTALSLAIKNKSFQTDITVIRQLVMFKSLDINITNGDGMTPFLLAISFNLRPIIEVLIVQRLDDINLKQKNSAGQSMEDLAKASAVSSDLVPFVKELIATEQVCRVTRL
jgi:hypothetical protein